MTVRELKPRVEAVGKRLWHSPTFTTWASTGTRFLSFVLVLPLLLRRLTPAEISVWWLLSTVISLQSLADLGFAPTFTRLIAYGMGGASDLRGAPAASAASAGPNWELIERVWSTMRVVYGRMTLLAALPLAVFGTWALVRPMRALDDPVQGWICWGVVFAASATVFWANAYAAYLQGVNQVALLRRWEALTSIATTITLFVVLLMGGRLLGLVIASQVWALMNVVRNWQLARIVNDGRAIRFRRTGIDHDTFVVAWPAAWRSGLGISFSRGVLYASGLIYAQVADAPALATYLLAFRWIQLVSEFSQAPFYSKIPVLARLRSEGRIADQLAMAKRGMQAAYWTYVAGFVSIGVAGTGALAAIGSRVAFADSSLWVLLGLGFFVERYGAMHIQLYSTTNHIIWHIATGVTGALYLAVSLGLLSILGVYAFPVGMLVGYLGFFSWYCAGYDYRLFGIGFWQFERTVVLPPTLIVAAYAAFTFLVD